MVPDDPLARRATSVRLIQLRSAGVLEEHELERALRYAAHSPSGDAWTRYLATILLLTGAALVLSGLLYLVAFNWTELDRFAKFGLCVAWIVAGFGAGLGFGSDTIMGRVGLTAASVGVGAWLAVIGQTYQTGAHDWSLFAIWAAVLVPWALVARASGLWALVMLIANVALIRWTYLFLFQERFASALCIAGLNAAFFVLWQLGNLWMPQLRVRWIPRALGSVVFVALLAPAVEWILTDDPTLVTTMGFILLVVLCTLVLAYGHRQPGADVFYVVAAGAAALVALDTALSRLLFDQWALESVGLLIMAALVLVQTGLFIAWASRLRFADDEEVAS